MNRPWPSLGVGWILALILLIVWVLVLFHLVAMPAELIAISFVLLCLALLL